MSRLEPGGGGVGCGGGTGSHPLPAVNVHVPDQVAGDGSASVILWWSPTQLDVFCSDLVNVHVSTFAGNIQHVHVGGGLECSSLANQLDCVSASVACSVSLETKYFCVLQLFLGGGWDYLWNAHNSVSFCVDCVLGIQLN